MAATPAADAPRSGQPAGLQHHCGSSPARFRISCDPAVSVLPLAKGKGGGSSSKVSHQTHAEAFSPAANRSLLSAAPARNASFQGIQLQPRVRARSRSEQSQLPGSSARKQLVLSAAIDVSVPPACGDTGCFSCAVERRGSIAAATSSAGNGGSNRLLCGRPLPLVVLSASLVLSCTHDYLKGRGSTVLLLLLLRLLLRLRLRLRQHTGTGGRCRDGHAAFVAHWGQGGMWCCAGVCGTSTNTPA